MVLGKRVAIFDWEWGQNWTLEMGRKGPVFANSLDPDQDRKKVGCNQA